MKLRFLMVAGLLGQLVAAFPPLQGGEPFPFPTVGFAIQPSEIRTLELGFSYSALGGHGDQSFILAVRKDHLEYESRHLPVSLLDPLLDSLHSLYPSPRLLTYQAWTDDYPYGFASLTLVDGRRVDITSSSQYGKMIPWNVRVWRPHTGEADTLLAGYVALHSDIHEGLSTLWRELEGEAYPRDYEGLGEFEETPVEEITFTARDNYQSAVESPVYGLPAGMLRTFRDLLEENDTISTLFLEDYTLFDGAFDLTVNADLVPVEFAGMLALRSGDGPDVAITSVVIDGREGLSVQTPVDLAKVTGSVSERRELGFLSDSLGVLPDLVFLHDFREPPRYAPEPYACPNRSSLAKDFTTFRGLLVNHRSAPVEFRRYRASDTWVVDVSMDRSQNTWSDAAAQSVLDHWMPPSFADFMASDLQSLSTSFAFTFAPGAAPSGSPGLGSLQRGLPSGVSPHIENPQKAGDYTTVSFNGALVLSDSSEFVDLVDCGFSPPDWYPPAFQLENVRNPSGRSLPHDYHDTTPSLRGWTMLRRLPPGDDHLDIQWTALGVAPAGQVHLLWTTDESVFYASGLADGSNWTLARRLGPDSWNLHVVTGASGEVHLIWSTFYPPGSVHVWRDSLGEWHEPEFWPGAAYFSDVQIDEQNNLHLVWLGSDGIDEEYLFAQWSAERGISPSENVSRMIGDVGTPSVEIRLDSKGHVHSLWAHSVSASATYDPLTGESSDQLGVFYSVRDSDGTWTPPARVGDLAPYAHGLGLELRDDQPVFIWQSDEGVSVASFAGGSVQPATLLARVMAPEEPELFGPERWVDATAELDTLQDANGVVYAVWSSIGTGLFLSRNPGSGWDEPQQIYEALTIEGLSSAISPDGDVHASFFADGALAWASMIGGHVESSEFLLSYDGYGLPVTQIEVDQQGLAYLLGLPRSPRWAVFVPPGGFPPRPPDNFISPPQPTVSLAPVRPSTPPPEALPLAEPSPSATGQASSASSAGSGLGMLIALAAAAAVAIAAFAIYRKGAGKRTE